MVMNIRYPDYQHCIANLACSILKHYGIAPPNAALEQVDALLQKDRRNIVLLVLDGMGTSILHRHLAQDGFFQKNRRFDYSSIFPPTTVTAVTAVSSGLFPNQSAWLGWTGYFPEIDRNIVYFLNKDNDTKEKIEAFHVANTFVPYEKVVDRIRKTGVEAYEIASFIAPYPRSYDDFCHEIETLCASGEKKFIYAYWDQPDKTMHPKGADDSEITTILTEIERKTEAMAAKLSDTLLLITADHGMVNVECEELTNYPELLECLVRLPSMEARAINLFVRQEMKEQFVQTFNRHFGKSYILLSKSEVMNRQPLGVGNDHAMLNAMLGDYLAVAIGSKAIRMADKGYIGEHAGMTEEEMTIPLIAVEKA